MLEEAKGDHHEEKKALAEKVEQHRGKHQQVMDELIAKKIESERERALQD